jgi:hypothetical protein
MIKAVAFVPPGPLNNEYVNNCLTHMHHRGYKVAGLVRGDWEAALAMVAGGEASVIVFARKEHMDEQWEPRVEFCGEETIRLCEAPGEAKPPRPRNDGPSGRRPRRIE